MGILELITYAILGIVIFMPVGFLLLIAVKIIAYAIYRAKRLEEESWNEDHKPTGNISPNEEGE